MSDLTLPFSRLVSASKDYATGIVDKIGLSEAGLADDLREILEGLAVQTAMASPDVLALLTHSENGRQPHALNTLCSLEDAPSFPPEYQTYLGLIDELHDIEDWDTAAVAFKIAHESWRETVGIDFMTGKINEPFEEPLCSFNGGTAAFREGDVPTVEIITRMMKDSLKDVFKMIPKPEARERGRPNQVQEIAAYLKGTWPDGRARHWTPDGMTVASWRSKVSNDLGKAVSNTSFDRARNDAYGQ